MSSRRNVKGFRRAPAGTGARMISAAQRNKLARAAGSMRMAQSSSRAIRSSQQKETGYVDVASTNYAMDTTGAIVLLNTVAQGASVNQRVGKRIQLKSLQCRGLMRSLTTTTFTDGAILIVYDRRPDGSLPAITAILDTVSSRSFNNDSNSDRFKVVRRWDRTFTGNTTTPATGGECFNFDEFVGLAGLPTVYKAVGTGAIGDISEGALYLVTVGSDAAGTAAASLTAGFRVRFVDV